MAKGRIAVLPCFFFNERDLKPLLPETGSLAVHPFLLDMHRVPNAQTTLLATSVAIGRTLHSVLAMRPNDRKVNRLHLLNVHNTALPITTNFLT